MVHSYLLLRGGQETSQKVTPYLPGGGGLINPMLALYIYICTRILQWCWGNASISVGGNWKLPRIWNKNDWNTCRRAHANDASRVVRSHLLKYYIYIYNIYIYIYTWKFPKMGVPLNHHALDLPLVQKNVFNSSFGAQKMQTSRK